MRHLKDSFHISCFWSYITQKETPFYLMKPGAMTHTCNPSIWEAVGVSEIKNKMLLAKGGVGILPAPGRDRTIPVQHGCD